MQKNSHFSGLLVLTVLISVERTNDPTALIVISLMPAAEEKSFVIFLRPNKKCVVQVTLPTLNFYPYPIFSPFWSKCSYEKENGRQDMHFKGFFFFDMNPMYTILAFLSAIGLKENQLCFQRT